MVEQDLRMYRLDLFLDGGGGGGESVPGIDLSLRETDPASFEWQNGMETTGWWAPRTNLPSVFNVPTPVIASVTEERYVTAAGARRHRARISSGFPSPMASPAISSRAMERGDAFGGRL